MPALADHAEERPEEPHHEAAPVEQRLEIFLDQLAAGLDALTSRKAAKRVCNSVAASATPAEASATTEAWPSEKYSPTPTGRYPSCISLRVTLSIAAM
ncbi:MAG TPA: hypothetical protein VKV32_10370 [Stellaceae bacterium]|nr:hypothetical protein [Stellaceae bacterium]